MYLMFPATEPTYIHSNSAFRYSKQSEQSHISWWSLYVLFVFVRAIINSPAWKVKKSNALVLKLKVILCQSDCLYSFYKKLFCKGSVHLGELSCGYFYNYSQATSNMCCRGLEFIGKSVARDQKPHYRWRIWCWLLQWGSSLKLLNSWVFRSNGSLLQTALFKMKFQMTLWPRLCYYNQTQN